MKKSNILTVVLALVAIAAIVFGIVTNGDKTNLKKQVEDLTAQVSTLKTSLDAAKQEVADAKAATETAVAEAVAAAKEEAAKALEDALAAAKTAVEAPAVMNHEEYVAAALESEVTVETYVQAKQSWWDNKAIIYCQSEDGGYLLYNIALSEEEYNALVPGTKIRVTGFKSEWSGEVEITDATYEILEGEAFIAAAQDVTALLGTDELIAHQNELVAFKGMTVEDYGDGNAFAYKNAENKTDDLYFKVSKDGTTYEFCVEYYLCNETTDVYKAVEALSIGDVIDMEGFLYWYNGANPHIISVTKAAE